MAVDDALSVHPTQAVFTSGLDLGTIAAGRVVEARVVSLAEGQAILSGRFGTLQVDLGGAKAAVGDVLRFEVQAVSGGDGKAGVALSLLGRTSPTTADPVATALPADTPARALAEAVGRAAARQSGLAPLFASLAGLASAPQGQVPEPVRTLVAQLMNTRLGADGAPTAATVARGFQGSGLFLESRQAAAANVAPSEDLKAGLKALGDALTRWLGPSARTDATAGTATSSGPTAIIRMPTVEGARPPAAAPGGTPVPSASTQPAGASPAEAVGGGGATSPAATDSAAAASATSATPATPGGRVAAQAYGAGRTDRPEPTATPVPSPRLASVAYGAPRAAPAGAVPAATGASPAVTAQPTTVANAASAPEAAAAPMVPAAGAAVRPAGADAATIDPATGAAKASAVAGEPETAPAQAPVAASTGGVAAAPDLPDAASARALPAEASPAPTVATASSAAPANPASTTAATVAGPVAAAEAVVVSVAAMAQALIEEGAGTSAAAQVVAQAEERGRVDRASRPPPPRRGSAPRGQSALPADTVEASSDGIEGVARRALARVDGALQRILLEQYAVLDHHDDATAAVSAGTRNGEWTAEIPIATRDGTAVMQMTVERDGGGRGGKAVKDGRGDWRVRFALDVEPIGAVTAQIGLAGEHLSIGLWIERPEMALRLGGAVGELRGALEAAAIPVEAIHVSAGRAPEAARTPASGRFVDVSL